MEIFCTNHDKRSAQARCVECGATLCADCRAKIEGRNYCRPCVPERLRSRMKGRRSPTAAAVLSAVPGLGQMYSGSLFRGLVFGGSALALASQIHQVPAPLPLFLWVFNMFDAMLLTQERNARVSGIELSRTDRKQKRFWGLFAGALALFTVARTTIRPDINPDLLWPVALGLYGVFLVTDRKDANVRTA